MRVVRGLLMLGGIAAIPAAIVLGRSVRVVLPQPERVTTRQAMTGEPSHWDSLALLLVSRDPFRADREPAPVAFNPNPVEQSDAPPAPPKPVLVLTGIVWSRYPGAIVEGLPGVDGSRLLRQGDVVGGVRVRRIAESRVELSGLDTTWSLEVRHPW